MKRKIKKIKNLKGNQIYQNKNKQAGAELSQAKKKLEYFII